ncbi:uncharacterized protein LOC119606474 isoform X2 [Lucilia sericata]|uniref:uncharacterized protein LOC119606474 isoform X2 n=1 Tax=Lucilia sericata TaxID=13632 RepID=UPI0018A8121B|nr:uncharacterized protein LOC119606474 isoform X2 [Lucilia sericata]XP_037815929.1 uncharacterized protein LOC119606474 isoform X2 [Lucilia sericata]
MVHETKQTSGKEKHHGHGEDEIAVADDEIEEIELSQKKTMYDRITEVMEKFASTRVGQMMIEKTDRVLKVVEDTAKWSLPQDDNEIQLERPLPWIFFLTLIVWLRVLRIWLSVASYIVGAQPVTPHTIVYYMQTKRRRLRAIRVQGLKSIRSREIENTVMYSSNKNVTFMGKLRKLFDSAICKPGQHREVPARRIFAQDGKGSKESTTERSSKRPRDEEVDQNLTVDEMLEKYANEDSDNDSDYVPKEDEENDDSSTSNTSVTSDEETEKLKPEQTDDTNKDSNKSQNDNKPKEQKKDEIKENGGVKHRPKPKPLEENKTESQAAADSENDKMHTPKETTNTNSSSEERQNNETPAATAEVAPPQTAMNTPKTSQNHLAAPKMEENKQKSTPGHESAASLKPQIVTATKAVPLIPHPEKVENKSYRTITTQTAIELDWTITIKTEITHTKHYPKLENIDCSVNLAPTTSSHMKHYPKLDKLDCSVNLTPASSTEDIFYSPVGSPQDFHSIFHPAPIVKDATGADFSFSPNFHAKRS